MGFGIARKQGKRVGDGEEEERRNVIYEDEDQGRAVIGQSINKARRSKERPRN